MKKERVNQYKIRYRLDSYICQGCGSPATQQAHRIARTKVNYRVYGKEVVDHNINTVSSCYRCNDSFNIGNKPRKAKRLAEYIEKNKNKKIESWCVQKYIEDC
jgi:5-methylcytosine-specific restriction endonuclease McrA